MSRVLIGSIRSLIRSLASASAAKRRLPISVSLSSRLSAPAGAMPTRQFS
jgi:hypothetical protein